MKLFLVFAMMFSQSVFAQDMSRTEKYDEVHVELEDGSVNYIGACSVHQDYEGIQYTITKTIVDYYVPDSENPADLEKQFRGLDQGLIEVAGGFEELIGTDDITLEKIEHKNLKHLDLYRYNIGVGGGNGFYMVVLRHSADNYERLSYVFDGDIEYCDQKVWIKQK